MPDVPEIPKGFATRLGQYGAAAFFVIGVAIYIFDLQVDWTALVAAGLAAVTAWTTISGRMLQSAAALRDAPSPAQLADLDGGASDLGEEDLDDDEELADVAPEEDDLADVFPDDPPDDPMPEGAVGGKPGMSRQEPPF